MSEIEADLDRAAAAYWMSVAAKASGGTKTIAFSRAVELLRDARAESGIPDSAKQPTLNELEAPPLDVPRSHRLKP